MDVKFYHDEVHVFDNLLMAIHSTYRFDLVNPFHPYSYTYRCHIVIAVRNIHTTLNRMYFFLSTSS